MYLQLAENNPLPPLGYTFVPGDENNQAGFVRNDVLAAAVGLSSSGDIYDAQNSEAGLSSFFGGLWGKIKEIGGKVVTTAFNTITGGGQQTQQPPIIYVNTPAAQGIDNKTMLLIGGGLLAAILLLKK